MNELISVIIPVYNTAKYLNRCFDSVINNSYKNLEIIVVDDSSTDGSSKICDDYQAKDNRFVVFHQENMGQASARNKALDVAKGDYISFIDSDDFIHNRFFEYLLTALQKTKSDITVCEMTREMRYDDFFSQNSYSITEHDKHEFIMSMYLGKWSVNIAPVNKIFKRYIFESLRFPIGKKYEDAMVLYKALMSAGKISSINIVMYYWYKNSISTTSKRDNAIILMDRELALREQMSYYPKEYEDVNLAARRFYLNQMQLMLWQLDHDFVQNETTAKVRRFFAIQAKKYFRKFKNLCSADERQRIFEYLYPKKSAIKHKINSIIKH